MTVNTHVWRTPTDEDAPISSRFPERNSSSLIYQEVVRDLQAKKDLGFAFSGGGTRAAAAAVGQLRALKELNWLCKARYLSAVSGGSWGTIPYLFSNYWRDDLILGYNPQVAEINDNFLNKKTGYLVEAVSEATMMAKFLNAAMSFAFDECFAEVISKIFLQPLSINDIGRFFTYSKETAEEIIRRNNELTLDDFIILKQSMPFPIINATLMSRPTGSLSEIGTYRRIFPLEITPIYVGIHKHFPGCGYNISDNGTTKRTDLGGGYIETFAYDSLPPKDQTHITGLQSLTTPPSCKVEIPSRRNRFSLSDAIAASGAAPHETITSVPGVKHVLGRNLGFPKFNHWPVQGLTCGKEDTEYAHGDGGHFDNLGILPLLSRGVKNIIVFVNTKIPLRYYDNFTDPSNLSTCANREDIHLVKEFHIAEEIVHLFVGEDKNPNTPQLAVFHDGKKKLRELYCGLLKRHKEGRATVYCDKYLVRPITSRHQLKFFLPREYSPAICWIYLNAPHNWRKCLKKASIKTKSGNNNPREELVPEVQVSTVNNLIENTGDFTSFPHYATFLENSLNFLELIQLTTPQVNALSCLSSWNLHDSAQTISFAFARHTGLHLPIKRPKWYLFSEGIRKAPTLKKSQN